MESLEIAAARASVVAVLVVELTGPDETRRASLRLSGFRAFRLPLVVKLLALRDGDLAFYPAVFHIHPGGHHHDEREIDYRAATDVTNAPLI